MRECRSEGAEEIVQGQMNLVISKKSHMWREVWGSGYTGSGNTEMDPFFS